MNSQQYFRRAVWGPVAIAMLAAVGAGVVRLTSRPISDGSTGMMDATDLFLVVSGCAAVGSLPASVLLQRWLKRGRSLTEIHRMLWITPAVMGAVVLVGGMIVSLRSSGEVAALKALAWAAGVMAVAYAYVIVVQIGFLVGRGTGAIRDG
jgi:hypothetical protein